MASSKSPRNGFACNPGDLKTTVDGIDSCMTFFGPTPKFMPDTGQAPMPLGNFNPNQRRHPVVVDPRNFVF